MNNALAFIAGGALFGGAVLGYKYYTTRYKRAWHKALRRHDEAQAEHDRLMGVS